jgi:hypothetical protein
MSVNHFTPALTPADALGDPAAPIIPVVAVAGDLDDAAARRLLRWCEAPLHLLDIGRVLVNHILVDLSHAHQADPTALEILDHARVEATRRHVGIHLVGAGAITAHAPLRGRHHLAGWDTFPTLDAARAALAPPKSNARRLTERSVDPDSILLVPPPTSV